MQEPVTLATGDNATYPGGQDITIRLTREQSLALGTEGRQLVNWLHTGLLALTALRGGPDSDVELLTISGNENPHSPDFWHQVINHLSHFLLPRLDGLLSASIRAHADCGGSYGQLATAMDVPKSTAQRRRDSINSDRPSTFDEWAQNGGPQPTSSTGGVS